MLVTKRMCSNGSIVRSHSPLETLCDVTKETCDALTPMIIAMYKSIESCDSEIVKLKKDNSVFTIADGAVQHLLVKHLFNRSNFRDVVCEEECQVNLQNQPYTVDQLVIPKNIIQAIETAQNKIDLLSKNFQHDQCYNDLTVFIDPIDGTREFSSGKGEQCSICIGFADIEGRPVAGVVYRPLSDRPTWAAGAKSEKYFKCRLRNGGCSNDDENLSTESRLQLLTTNGSISQFLEALVDESQYKRTRSGGAGNKMLLLLESEEEKGSAVYIQDRGVSRWDTCAAQACLEAQGGMLCKLSSFISSDHREESYTYLGSDENLDFPGEDLVQLTNHNTRNSIATTQTTFVKDVAELKPYANVCGLVALGKAANTEETKKKISKALQLASQRAAPIFN